MQFTRVSFLPNCEWRGISWTGEGGSSFWSYHKHFLYVVGAGVGVYVAGRAYFSYKRSQRRKRWNAAERDLVILHQLERGKNTPNISPFPMKLETYLRMAGIPYECDFEEPMGPKGKTPWITINGQEIADSQLIIEFLGRKFHKDFSHHLTPEQRAIARAFQIMMEEHLCWTLALWRWVYTNREAVPTMQVMSTWLHLMAPLISRRVKSDAYGQGMGRHTQAEVVEMGIKDLKACSTFLGEKSFLMGDEPTEADCAIFGMLAQALWNTPDSPFEQLVNGELVNLKNYCLRMKERFWPDWDRNLSPPRV